MEVGGLFVLLPTARKSAERTDVGLRLIARPWSLPFACRRVDIEENRCDPFPLAPAFAGMKIMSKL
jgi:hypothetical protein